MAIAVTPVTGASTTWGNKRIRVVDIVFSGNYATGGEAITAASVGLRNVDQFIAHGSSLSTALTTSEAVSYNYATGKLLFYEAAAANAPLAEKGNAEAYVAGTKVRATVVGF